MVRYPRLDKWHDDTLAISLPQRHHRSNRSSLCAGICPEVFQGLLAAATAQHWHLTLLCLSST
uniref:Uncharacterized protein n=1 Tax=Anguilla anguilla TaxID=7936 RepID=A0A0E9T7D1_ANGAN